MLNQFYIYYFILPNFANFSLLESNVEKYTNHEYYSKQLNTVGLYNSILILTHIRGSKWYVFTYSKGTFINKTI